MKRHRLDTTSTAQSPGVSGEGGPSSGVSAPIGSRPGVVDSHVVASTELDLQGPSRYTTECAHIGITQRKLGKEWLGGGGGGGGGGKRTTRKWSV